MAYSSVMAHPSWQTKILPCLRVERYRREGKGRGRPRIEVKAGLTSSMYTYLANITVACPRCGNEIHPFRFRKKGGGRVDTNHMYYATACELKDDVGCSRSHQASDEFEAVADAVEVYVLSGSK